MTTEFHKILVPVDFSPCSLEAYRTAVILAEQFGGEILVLHVIDTRILESLMELPAGKTDAPAKVLQKKARLRFRSFLSGLSNDAKIRRIIVTGVPFHEIVKIARLERTDLIVMGRYGGTGELEKIFFGSTAEKVVRIAPCAVLSIPLQDRSRKSAPLK
jgi:nucleotide-binding universal stress UspA family protein